jgi:transposase
MNSLQEQLEDILKKLKSVYKRHEELKDINQQLRQRVKVLEEELGQLKNQLENQITGQMSEDAQQKSSQHKEDFVHKEIVKKRLDDFVAEIDQCIDIIQSK